MAKLKTVITLTFVLAIISSRVFSQELYDDGSMKLSEISTDKKYGYEPNHKTSVKVGKIENEYAYILALLGPNGEKIQASRNSSCCEFKSKTAVFGSGFLDKWEITYEGLKSPVVIYLNGYDYEAPKCPYGFTFKTIDKLTKVERLPADSIIHVSACNAQTIYSVDDLLLKEKSGRELPKPDKNPEFIGGLDELKKYFIDHPLTDENVKQLVFRVSISFLVTCDGKPGNFEIVTKGRGELEIYANEVLAIVNRMPQTWQPATKENKVVDCYQVLSFSVDGGQLDKVSFR